jgi:hypothetical protein
VVTPVTYKELNAVLLNNVVDVALRLDILNVEFVDNEFKLLNIVVLVALKFFIDNIELRKQDNENNYIYNVNPSIWKLSSLMSVMKTFSNETYRTIELMPTQLYCKQFNVYKLYSDKYINCGWFSCLEIFEFIHITHHGKLLPKVYNNLDAKLVNDYTNIIEKILKSNTNRTFSERKL